MLLKIQLLDPPGIASRSIQECIIAQIKTFYPEDSFSLNIIENYFEEFINKKFDKIKHRLKCEDKQIIKLLEIISTLNPNPAINYNKSANNHITPDIIGEKVDGNWVINLNEMPYLNLRINGQASTRYFV